MHVCEPAGCAEDRARCACRARIGARSVLRPSVQTNRALSLATCAFASLAARATTQVRALRLRGSPWSAASGDRAAATQASGWCGLGPAQTARRTCPQQTARAGRSASTRRQASTALVRTSATARLSSSFSALVPASDSTLPRSWERSNGSCTEGRQENHLSHVRALDTSTERRVHTQESGCLNSLLKKAKNPASSSGTLCTLRCSADVSCASGIDSGYGGGGSSMSPSERSTYLFQRSPRRVRVAQEGGVSILHDVGLHAEPLQQRRVLQVGQHRRLHRRLQVEDAEQGVGCHARARAQRWSGLQQATLPASAARRAIGAQRAHGRRVDAPLLGPVLDHKHELPHALVDQRVGAQHLGGGGVG